MRNETPAALPLIGLICGLAVPLVNPWVAIAGLLLITLRIRPAAFVALGIFLSLQLQSRVARERSAFGTLDPEVFVTIDAPLERDWSPRDESFVLRASRFTIGNTELDTPIAIYARFEPPEIAMEATVRAEGFLRQNERGEYSMGVKSPTLLAYRGSLPRWHPRAWNRALANAMERHAAAHPDEVALAQALVLGRGERLTPEMKKSFRGGGTYHLLVFSGLQIAFAAGLLAALLRWLHKPRASDWLLLTFAVLAPLFIGPTASVSRASIGIGLYALSRILKRPTSLENLWCVAALLRLIVEPRDLIDPSFHLTYAGAGALLFIGRHLRPRALGYVAAAEVAISPLTLFHFHQYALGGSLITFLMSPVIFVMLIASALACAFPPLFHVIGLLHRACTMLNALGMSGWFASPPVPALIASALASLLAIALLRQRARAIVLIVALLIPSCAAIVKSLRQRNVEHPTITFFDIGQGDAIVLRSGTHTVLVDGGRGERILPLLADRGIRRLDAVVLSHAHPDHCEGLAAALAAFEVGRIWISPRRFRGDCAAQVLESARAPIHLVRDGDSLALGELAVRAHVADSRFRRAPENNSSIVLHVSARKRSFLLTGDIEKEAELWLSDRDLRADVLKVAHHGSRSSTTEAFLDNAAPRLAVISCGRHNLFGHPHPSVIESLDARGIRTWRTDRHGSIDVAVRGGHLYVTTRSD
ncbi:MAG TPA: DNA internalization-related competence protein ComEC/Rec2 [Thermoanaerobaculia bacterium]|nr:DNA internalization-related competence protein ComEC/Rec2 [Thermoanaerobaculia bacterium]